jgi:hypothetical protein
MILVVVDAQKGYISQGAPVRPRIVREVGKQLALEKPVVLLEMYEWDFPARGGIDPDHLSEAGLYWHGGRTIAEVRALLEPKAHLFQLRLKKRKNGTEQVLDACSALGVSGEKHFRLCGGYLDGCLLNTAVGLLCAVPDSTVEIAGEAAFLNRACAWMDLFGWPCVPPLVTLHRTEGNEHQWREIQEILGRVWGVDVDRIRELTTAMMTPTQAAGVVSGILY